MGDNTALLLRRSWRRPQQEENMDVGLLRWMCAVSGATFVCDQLKLFLASYKYMYPCSISSTSTIATSKLSIVGSSCLGHSPQTTSRLWEFQAPTEQENAFFRPPQEKTIWKQRSAPRTPRHWSSSHCLWTWSIRPSPWRSSHSVTLTKEPWRKVDFSMNTSNDFTRKL